MSLIAIFNCVCLLFIKIVREYMASVLCWHLSFSLHNEAVCCSWALSKLCTIPAAYISSYFLLLLAFAIFSNSNPVGQITDS